MRTLMNVKDPEEASRVLKIKMLMMEHGEWLVIASYWVQHGAGLEHLYEEAIQRCCAIRGEIESLTKEGTHGRPV